MNLSNAIDTTTQAIEDLQEQERKLANQVLHHSRHKHTQQAQVASADLLAVQAELKRYRIMLKNYQELLEDIELC